MTDHEAKVSFSSKRLTQLSI